MDKLTRFIRSKNNFSKKKNRVKPAAFMPIFNDDSNRFETSSFFIDDLEETSIWDLGNKYIQDIQIKARGDFKDKDVEKSDLNIDFNNNPERHADIIGWDKDNKPKRKEQALKLADKSDLKISPDLV